MSQSTVPEQPARGKKLRRIIIILLWSFLATILGTEVLLRLTDPLGVIDIYDDLILFHENFVVDPQRGYVLPEGQYDFNQWTATITSDQTRLVPDTNPNAACTIAMVGDSVTFGHGVNDDQTFTNLLARQFPDVRFIDAGLDGYNIDNVLGTIRSVPADAYIYFVIHNDNDPPLKIGIEGRLNFMLTLYVFRAIHRYQDRTKNAGTENPAPPVLPDWFIADAQTIAGFDNVLMAGNEGDNLLPYLRSLDDTLVTIPLTKHRVSPADPHPNAEGHAEMAQSLLPYVRDWIAQQCPSG